MSTLNSEWSSPFSGNPPESLAPLVERVGEFVRAISTPRPAEGSYSIPDRPRIISIFGSRGTGKSTLLRFAAIALSKHQDHLVLPIIDPEAFAPGDSLAGWVLAQFEREFQTSDRVHEVGPDGRSLEQLLEDLRRAQAARGSAYFEG